MRPFIAAAMKTPVNQPQKLTTERISDITYASTITGIPTISRNSAFARLYWSSGGAIATRTG